MFRIAKDEWESKEVSILPRPLKDSVLKYDKFQHFIGGFILGLFGIWVGIIAAVLWEVKDGYVPYEKGYKTFGYNWGGDGFSWKDMVTTIYGSIAGALLVLFLSCAPIPKSTEPIRPIINVTQVDSMKRENTWLKDSLKTKQRELETYISAYYEMLIKYERCMGKRK